jgi:hypothetical protein
MKKIGLLSLGLAAAIAIIFCSSERPFKGWPVFSQVAAPVSTDRSALPLSDASEGQQPSARTQPISRDSVDATLVSIRGKLARLGRIPKADKGAEDELMTGLLATLTDANAAEITRALSAEDLQSRFGLAALRHWLKVDALAAADWVAARTDATVEQAGVVARELIDDPVALERYCLRLPENAWRQMFLAQAAEASMWRDPVQALHLTEQMNAGSAQLDLMQTTLCTWMISHPTAASDWIRNVQVPLLREEFVSVGAKTLAAVDPLKALDWLIASVPPATESSEPLIDETIQDIFVTWTETAPAQAASGMAHFPSGELRESLVNLVSRGWLQRDPAAAVDWIKSLPERDRIQAASLPR